MARPEDPAADLSRGLSPQRIAREPSTAHVGDRRAAGDNPSRPADRGPGRPRERGAGAHRTALRRRDVRRPDPGHGPARAGAQPRGRVVARPRTARAERGASRRGHRTGPARRRASARGHERHARCRPRRRGPGTPAPARRGRPALVASGHAGGAQPGADRSPGGHPLRADRGRAREPRVRGGLRPRARDRRSSLRHAAALGSPAAAEPGGGRLRARHRPPQLQHRRAGAPAAGARLPGHVALAGRLPGAPQDPGQDRGRRPGGARPR